MQDNQDLDTNYAVTTVTDDDDDDGDHHNNASNDGSAAVTAEQDRLRIAAEKRRQKILDQANTRMSIVEGTYNNNSTTSMAAGTTVTNTEATTEMTSNAMNMESVVEDTGTETPVEPVVVDTPATDSASATTTATTTTSSTTTSSKLAAMRRRRFQKKATPTTTSSSIVPTMEDPTTEATSTDAVAVVIDESTKVVSHDNVELIQEEVGNNATMNQNMEPEENITELELESKVDDPMDTENATTTKKYLGVAKMRRRMIKERQEQQQQLLGTDNDDDDTQMKSNRSKSNAHGGSNTVTTSNKNNIVLPKKYRPMITTLPILMYAVTTLLLFITGLNIGLQQSQINYCYQNNNHQYPVRTTTKTTTISGDGIDNTNDNMAAAEDGYCYNTSNEPQWSVLVHSELAPRKMGGLQRLLSIMNLGVVVIPPTTTITGIPNEEELLVDTGFVLDDTEDEFSITEPTMKNTMHQGNIDPLFQVDLDALTAGDGLYFMLGRFAVRIHRSILTVVYYTPKSILQSILSIMWSFIQTPPILFIMALFIRHGLGKVILGAKLPKAVVDETQHKDILSTVKTFVTKFLLSSFPTITIFYDVWTYIRSDMYVILCGLFVGIALSHHHQAGSPYGETTTNTISNTFTTTHTTPMDGIADEL